ncbi:MAG TPA: beta-galactosidase, partial [Bacteroidota bacterium]
QVQPHRQIGGLGICWNHQEVMEHLYAFLAETVRRYKDHPALEIWNVASEPELTQSMAELRLFADDAGRIGDMLCYCDHCRRAFVAWLAAKYRTIDALNLRWNRNYADFDEVELPRTRNSFGDVIDWRMFFVHTLGENVRRRFDVARAEDPRHPLMCHHVFIQGFPVTSTANDPWNVGRFGDLHGITQMDDPMMCDVLRSCARGKPVISAEMLVLFGYTLDLPRLPGPDDMKRNIFTGVAADLKGFIFWQFRPETLAREAPAWGLTALDGSPTPWLSAFAECGGVLQKNAEFLLDASPRKPDAALLYCPENQIFGWAATGNEKNVTDSLLGMHRALYNANFTLDLVHSGELNEVLDRYATLVVPFPYFLSADACRTIARWVEAGGTLIAEAYMAGWDAEEGRHQTTVPGYGLEKLFGARQLSATSAGEEGMVEFSTVLDLPGVSSGTPLRGAMVREAFAAGKAKVLARYANGETAATIASYGKGKAVLLGSYLALPYYRGLAPENGAFLAALVETLTPSDHPRVEGEPRVRLDLLTPSKGKGLMLIARNLWNRSVSAAFSLPPARQEGVRRCVEQFTGEALELETRDGRIRGTLHLQAGEVKVYRA